MQDIYHTIIIDINNGNQRFDRFLRKLYKPYTTITLTTIYSWIRKWYIRINNKKGDENTKILLWDNIIINISKTIPLQKDTTYHTSVAYVENERNRIHQNILFENDNRLVFNKPPHILMHPGSGASQKAITMNDWLYTYLNEERRNNWDNTLTQWSTFKPAFCYRLDKDTSGVLIAAKQYDALQYLNALIKERKVIKRYVVVTNGILPKELIIDKPLFKWFHWEKWRAHMFVNYEKWLASKTAIYHIADTNIEKIWKVSLWLVRLMTGRMHQIRVHTASEGYPVVWDKDYWNEWMTRIADKQYWIHRQLLHSFAYSFYDTYTENNIEFIAPLPEDIKKIFTTINEKEITKKIHSILSSKYSL